LHLTTERKNIMADETQLESGQSGEQELPTPSFSDQATSSTSSGADDIVSKLLPQLEQMIERKVQSVKDKRISEIEKALGGRSKILAELESEGVNIPKDVRTTMQIRELEERLAQQTAQPAQKVDDGSSTQKAAVQDAIAKLSEFGLSSNDPAFIELLRGKYANRDAFDKAVLGHVVGKLAPQKPPNPADVVQAPARAGATDKGVDALTDEYKKQVRAARGNRAEIARLRGEYQKQGVPVHEVDFS
jgi:hypothetical protein